MDYIIIIPVSIVVLAITGYIFLYLICSFCFDDDDPDQFTTDSYS